MRQEDIVSEDEFRRNRWNEKRNGMYRDKERKSFRRIREEDDECSTAEAIRRQMREEGLPWR